MDDQNRQYIADNQPPDRQAETTTIPEPMIPNPDHKPTLNISDEQAQSLLAINDLQSGQAKHNSTRLPISLIITLITVVAIVIVASVLLDGLNKHQTNSSASSSGSTVPSSSSSNANNNSATNQTDKQINQDVNSCSNPLTAVSQC